ncbi:hypothetical protein DFA_02951 [Cavenderia fasciculata]|uniref:Ankyrin repeat-containing protein n=1 Tax=Cavenderia fasciculata TaxID=261658 RepID=F4PG73_CACFS|nr:uncharacterized protein DFA_02951 [Cavenderia fasciculata]EGG24707.1 hypothetical protein DFA_02951 [Cavenderia fasciculata]|eukprot:XP_004362558.1 hypothetical protein DFA_02951 [Cavenderia fasciculata]
MSFQQILQSHYIRKLIFGYVRDIHTHSELYTFQADHLKHLSVGYLLTHQCKNLIPLKLGYTTLVQPDSSSTSSSSSSSLIFKSYKQSKQLWCLKDFDQSFFMNNHSLPLFLYFYNTILKDEQERLYFFTVMYRSYYVLDVCCGASLEIVKFLHERHFNYHEPYLYAIDRNNMAVLKYLFDTPTFTFKAKQRMNALARASKRGLFEMIHELLKECQPPDHPFYVTVQTLHDVIEPNMTAFDRIVPIQPTTENQKLALLQLFLEVFKSKVQVREKFMKTSPTDSTKLIPDERMVDKLPPLEIINIHFASLLGQAARRGYLNITKYLISLCQKDPSIHLSSSKDKITLLHYAIHSNHFETIQFIYQFIIDLNNNNNNQSNTDVVIPDQILDELDPDLDHRERFRVLMQNQPVFSSGTFRAMSWHNLELIKFLDQEKVFKVDTLDFQDMLTKTNGSFEVFKYLTNQQDKFPQFYCPSFAQVSEKIQEIQDSHRPYVSNHIFQQIDPTYYHCLNQ